MVVFSLQRCVVLQVVTNISESGDDTILQNVGNQL
jgi:hypothetical protein